MMESEKEKEQEQPVNPFGEWLRTARKERSWSRADLGDRSGVSHMAIWNSRMGVPPIRSGRRGLDWKKHWGLKCLPR
jgi:hypothetical protein